MDTSNTVNGKPIYYWVEQHDRTVPSDAGLVVLKNCSGITVQGLSLEGNGDGILLHHITDSTISGNIIANNVNGITLTESSNNIISDNQIRNNRGYGIQVKYSSTSNIILKNEIISNTKDGIYIESSINNSVTENQLMENNGNGIYFYSIQDCSVIANNITLNKGAGIGFGWGPNGTIKGNYISRNNKGIWMGSAFENTITFNTIIENSVWGIELGDTQRDNVIHHNNFINNNITGGEQVRIASLWTFPGEPEPPKYVEGAANAWDDGTEGNYWSNYDGNGNSPYIINGNNQDNHPLTDMVDITEIPEFPPWIVLPLFLIATLFAIVIRKKIYRKNNT
jgi:parallel beta-helix repeat protein